MARQHWQANLEESCPYLPGLTSLTDYRILSEVEPEDYEEMLARGWRRFGWQYFRPQCVGCQECVSLRIPVTTFRPSKSQRRAWRKCQHLEVFVGKPRVTSERLEVFHAWHQMREEKRGWNATVMTEEDYHSTFCPPNATAREMAYYDGGRLVAVGLIDVAPHSVSSIYFYYHPDAAAWSPGVASVLFELEYARQRGCAHLYLGYRVLGCPSTAYKAQYGPHELLEGRPEADEEPIWFSEPAS